MTSQRTIFFDLRGTLGAVRRYDSGPVLEVYPFMRGVRSELGVPGTRLGLVCDTCAACYPTVDVVQRMLEAAGISDWFEAELCVFGATNTIDVFQRARALAGSSCWYVSRDAVACARAEEAGLAPVPHGVLVGDAASGQSLSYVKVSGAGAAARVEGVHTTGVVALELIGPDTAYAVVSEAGAAQLVAAGLSLAPLDAQLSPATSLYRLRDDRTRDARGVLARWDRVLPELRALVAQTDEAVYLALGPGDDIERYHIAGAHHGGSQFITADSTLTIGRSEEPVSTNTKNEWTDAAKTALRAISPAAIAEDVRQLVSCGAAAGAEIGSRHVRHRGNEVAVDWLEARLRSFGSLRVSRHCFPYRGRELHNVEAELPGTSSELVLVTAHFDSTVTPFIHPYDPTTDIAPGADDDASGVAAVLAVAHAFVNLARACDKPRRTVRFVLFNAEEVGLQGSSMYAHDEVMRDAKISAVFQMDMVGYRASPNETSRPCEIHVGAFPNYGVEARSGVLAGFVTEAIDAGLGESVREPQIYTTRMGDRARLRSDHSQFHLRDYAACLISEDFWPNPPSAPLFQPNPEYHSARDTTVITDYTADIARVVAAAAMCASALT